MLGWPLNWNMSRDIMRNDLERYEVSKVSRPCSQIQRRAAEGSIQDLDSSTDYSELAQYAVCHWVLS